MMNRLFLILIISVLTVTLYGQGISDNGEIADIKGGQSDFRNFLREGNRQYNARRVDDAERAYRHALGIDERSDMATFNLGSALYRQERYEEAVKEFEKAASATTDKMEKARAYHNLGNSHLQQMKLKESIEAYKQALRNNPNDLDTKYNLSYAMDLLKQQEQDQDNQDDNQDNQDNQDQQEQNQDNQDNEDQDQQPQDQNKDENQPLQPQQISPEDAQRMLDAIAQEEKELLEKLQQKERAGHRPAIVRNW